MHVDFTPIDPLERAKEIYLHRRGEFFLNSYCLMNREENAVILTPILSDPDQVDILRDFARRNPPLDIIGGIR